MNLKTEITRFLLEKDLEETDKDFIWHNSNDYKSAENLEKELERILLFFKLRGYQFKKDSFKEYLVNNKPRIAGIQAYKEEVEGSLVDLFYCTRFDDLEDTSRHYPGFFMLGLHSFKIKTFLQLSFHLETILDFFRNKGINRINWDNWTDGVYEGPCIEFFKDDLEVGNMVFITSKNNEDLKEIILDLGIGWQRYCNLVSVDIPRRNTLLILNCILFYLNKLQPGRRGIQDNVKRIYRITSINNLEEQVTEALKYWELHTTQNLSFRKNEIIEYLQKTIPLYSVIA